MQTAYINTLGYNALIQIACNVTFDIGLETCCECIFTDLLPYLAHLFVGLEDHVSSPYKMTLHVQITIQHVMYMYMYIPFLIINVRSLSSRMLPFMGMFD